MELEKFNQLFAGEGNEAMTTRSTKIERSSKLGGSEKDPAVTACANGVTVWHK